MTALQQFAFNRLVRSAILHGLITWPAKPKRGAWCDCGKPGTIRLHGEWQCRDCWEKNQLNFHTLERETQLTTEQWLAAKERIRLSQWKSRQRRKQKG